MFQTSSLFSAAVCALPLAAALALTTPSSAHASESCSVDESQYQATIAAGSAEKLATLQAAIALSVEVLETHQVGVYLDFDAVSLEASLDEIVASGASDDLGLTPEMIELIKNAFDDPVVLGALDAYHVDEMSGYYSHLDALDSLQALSDFLYNQNYEAMVEIHPGWFVLAAVFIAGAIGVAYLAGYTSGMSAVPNRYSPNGDLDGDGIPNRNDGDIDGDGSSNAQDSYPYDKSRQCFPSPIWFLTHAEQGHVAFTWLDLTFTDIHVAY